MTELCDFDFADLAGYLLARQMRPSDAARLSQLLLNNTTEFTAGLDLGLSRPSNCPPRNSQLLKTVYSDRENDRENQQPKRPNRAKFALSHSRSLSSRES